MNNIKEIINDREMAVLTLIGNGDTNKEIANKLCVSVRTVETRRQNLLPKNQHYKHGYSYKICGFEWLNCITVSSQRISV